MHDQTIVERAKSFLYRNGRLLDRRRYEYWCEGGSAEAVIAALRAYRNEDGGFGNALEPDIRCPYSQPVPTEMALSIMDETACFDPELIEGIMRYLRQITLPDGGFPTIFRNAGEYPHAPWWGTDRDDRPSINPTGSIIGMLYKMNLRASLYEEEWFRKNVAYVWRVFEQETPHGYHDGIQWITFLQHTPDRERARVHRHTVDDWLRQPGTIERDPQAQGYVQKVLDWAPLRDSYAGSFVTPEEVRLHLEALVGQQQADGGWPISWQPPSSVAEAEWRGYLTVERIKTMQSYGLPDR